MVFVRLVGGQETNLGATAPGARGYGPIVWIWYQSGQLSDRYRCCVIRICQIRPGDSAYQLSA